MELSAENLELLKANSLTVENARELGRVIENDLTISGIFPNANQGDFEKFDETKFKNKYCSWWPVARILLTIAKSFTNDKVDKVIDQLISVGDRVCR